MISECKTCKSRYHVDRDEDGRPDPIPGQCCSDPKCGRWLCPLCLEHFSFTCEDCGGPHCNEHLVTVPDAGRLRNVCLDCRDRDEDPPCECVCVGDQADNSACPAHGVLARV